MKLPHGWKGKYSQKVNHPVVKLAAVQTCPLHDFRDCSKPPFSVYRGRFVHEHWMVFHNARTDSYCDSEEKLAEFDKRPIGLELKIKCTVKCT